MSENAEPDEALIARVQEVLAGAQAGSITGIICVCFTSNGSIHIQVAGQQPLIARLGSLVVASDALKLLETQQAIAREQSKQWAPGSQTPS
jgi:hypothetical protein